eukprot:m.95795 g.95795  ORF g.95795 m.95795 type:complete len:422 (+) comp16617_c2_seq5:1459-2724(+)
MAATSSPRESSGVGSSTTRDTRSPPCAARPSSFIDTRLVNIGLPWCAFACLNFAFPDDAGSPDARGALSPASSCCAVSMQALTCVRNESRLARASSSEASFANSSVMNRLVSSSTFSHSCSSGCGPSTTFVSSAAALHARTCNVKSSIIPCRSSADTSLSACSFPSNMSSTLAKKMPRKRPIRFTAAHAVRKGSLAPLVAHSPSDGSTRTLERADVDGGSGSSVTSSRPSSSQLSRTVSVDARFDSVAGAARALLTAIPQRSNIWTLLFSTRSKKLLTPSMSSLKDGPHPKTRDRSLPVPNGSTPSWQLAMPRLSASCRIQPMVPSPPQPSARNDSWLFINSSPGPGPALERSITCDSKGHQSVVHTQRHTHHASKCTSSPSPRHWNVLFHDIQSTYTNAHTRIQMDMGYTVNVAVSPVAV